MPNRSLGTGYLDGTKILSGISPLDWLGTFLVNELDLGDQVFSASSVNVLFTETDNTKDAYINPDALLYSKAAPSSRSAIRRPVGRLRRRGSMVAESPRRVGVPG